MPWQCSPSPAHTVVGWMCTQRTWQGCQEYHMLPSLLGGGKSCPSSMQQVATPPPCSFYCYQNARRKRSYHVAIYCEACWNYKVVHQISKLMLTISASELVHSGNILLSPYVSVSNHWYTHILLDLVVKQTLSLHHKWVPPGPRERIEQLLWSHPAEEEDRTALMVPPSRGRG